MSSKLRQEAGRATTRRHVSHGLDPTVPFMRALVPPTRPAILDPRLPTREGSDVATRLVAMGPASLTERAPELPRVAWHRTRPPSLGGLCGRHVSHNYLWGMDKEVFGHNGKTTRITR
jgi:hypothetical protein